LRKRKSLKETGRFGLGEVMTDLVFKCPECGDPLSVDFQKDKEGKVSIEFFCEGAGDDAFSFQISTGLKNKDVKELQLGKPLVKEMIVELLERKSEF
jgi:hypothetical protein